MTEAQLQDAIVDLAHLYGWAVAHFRPARTEHGWRTPAQYDAAGFVDLVLVHPRRGVIFAEVKSDRGKVRPDQRAWLDRLEAAGAHADIWRPVDFPDRIAPLLSGERALTTSNPGGTP